MYFLKFALLLFMLNFYFCKKENVLKLFLLELNTKFLI